MVHTLTPPVYLPTQARSTEVIHKLQLMRQALVDTQATGLRLRGTDWFAWATAGASNTVLLTAETGVAEVLVTLDGAWVLTDEIEAQRLQDEELVELVQKTYTVHISPWAQPDQREAFIQKMSGNGLVLSDRPTATEHPLPNPLITAKRILLPSEIERYRQVGQLAGAAMLEVLSQAQPDWTEYQLAGIGAEALWRRGLHPALTLAAGAGRLPHYRHPTPSNEMLSSAAMLVFCARGYGLIASLTRFVYFGDLPTEQEQRHQQVRAIEAAALDQCHPGKPLNQIYQTLKQAYEQQGYPQGITAHHQGGTAGYLAREVVATPTTTEQLQGNMAIAWNPSLAGAKIEDTFVVRPDGSLENLTLTPDCPAIEVHGRSRPLPLVID